MWSFRKIKDRMWYSISKSLIRRPMKNLTEYFSFFIGISVLFFQLVVISEPLTYSFWFYFPVKYKWSYPSYFSVLGVCNDNLYSLPRRKNLSSNCQGVYNLYLYWVVKVKILIRVSFNLYRDVFSNMCLVPLE